jgi:uncharacterized protein YjbJ (UPF0337 family)
MENQTWTEMKSKIKSRWAKLTDENIEAVKNDLSSLKGQLETTYGYSKEFALKEFNQLMGKSGEGVAKPVEASSKSGEPGIKPVEAGSKSSESSSKSGDSMGRSEHMGATSEPSPKSHEMGNAKANGALKFGGREEESENDSDEDQSENKSERTFGGRNENKSESKSKSRDDKAIEQFARDRH